MNIGLRLASIGILLMACGFAPAAEEVARPQAQPLAPAKPLTANSYAGYKGLTADQLSRAPGTFDRNPKLSNSIPGPVFYTELSGVPTTPPFISPAFVPRSGPQLGVILPSRKLSSQAASK
jgi:hypothetical protein